MLTLRLALLLSAASIGLTIGFVTVFRKFIRLHSAEDTESALSWHEGPYRSLFLDISQGFTVALKDLTILAMASLLLICPMCVAGFLLSLFLFRTSTLWSQFLQMTFVLLFIQTSGAIARRYLFAGERVHSPDSRSD
jgi:hypothetical protein